MAYTHPNRRKVFGQYAAISGPPGGIIVGEIISISTGRSSARLEALGPLIAHANRRFQWSGDTGRGRGSLIHRRGKNVWNSGSNIRERYRRIDYE
jgi:hypothetical protein